MSLMIEWHCARTRRLHRVVVGVALLVGSGLAGAQVVQLPAAADGSMYAESGGLANGSGASLFAGRIADGTRRRALLRFGVDGAVPAGATVTGATLELSLTRTIADPLPFSLHRLTAGWGEGASDAGEPGGRGAPAAVGDVTWQFRFYPDQPWALPGGDFIAGSSAITIVPLEEGRYAWSGSGLVADVQQWLQDPASNHGWLLVGDESVPGPSAKRFASREHPLPGLRPLLTVTWSTAPPPVAQAVSIPVGGNGVLMLLAGLLGLAAVLVLRAR